MESTRSGLPIAAKSEALLASMVEIGLEALEDELAGFYRNGGKARRRTKKERHAGSPEMERTPPRQDAAFFRDLKEQFVRLSRPVHRNYRWRWTRFSVAAMSYMACTLAVYTITGGRETGDAEVEVLQHELLAAAKSSPAYDEFVTRVSLLCPELGNALRSMDASGDQSEPHKSVHD